MWRSVPAPVDVILPKFASPRLPSGVLNCGVLARLKHSVRNCTLMRSVISKSLKSEKSTLRVGGLKASCSMTLPIVPEAGGEKLAVLNHSLGLRPLGGAAYGLPVTIGVHTPSSTPSQPLEVMVKGWPVWKVKMVLACQLPRR